MQGVAIAKGCCLPPYHRKMALPGGIFGSPGALIPPDPALPRSPAYIFKLINY